MPFRGFTRRQVDREIKLDVALIQGLASHNTELKGMKLSRFDRTLGLNRERIERVYRGRGGGINLKVFQSDRRRLQPVSTWVSIRRRC